jgi:L-alanine-DL-glutamate epimerase-like enolase superfamily enzyme
MTNANYQTYRDLAIRKIEAIPVAIPMLRAIKCARTGYTQSRQILALARGYYTPVHNGTQADMQIGSAAAAHFACTYTTVHAHEFSSFLDAKDHVADQDLVIKNGQLIVPEGPGIGLSLDPKKLKKYRLDK